MTYPKRVHYLTEKELDNLVRINWWWVVIGGLIGLAIPWILLLILTLTGVRW